MFTWKRLVDRFEKSNVLIEFISEKDRDLKLKVLYIFVKHPRNVDTTTRVIHLF